MAASKVSSIIFFFLFIIISLCIVGDVFAAPMEHRKLGGSKGPNKIATRGSTSKHSGQKNTYNAPTTTHPDQAQRKDHLTDKAQRKDRVTYKALQRGAVTEAYSKCHTYSHCKKVDPGN